MAWCAIHRTKVIGPYFFRQSSVDAAAQKSLLRYHGLHHIKQLQGAQKFHQYGAPTHWSRLVTEYLKRKLGDRRISKRGLVNWPTRFPDLIPLDFLLWGYVKDKAYAEKIESIEYLNSRITQAIRIIDAATLSNVWKNLNTRINFVVRQEGGHIDQLTF